MWSEHNSSWGFLAASVAYHKTFLPQIIERFNRLSSYIFTPDDVLAMATICPFQVNAMGYSPFCDIFTDRDWMDLNYADDLGAYYASGEGNPFGRVLGQPWVSAVISLMKRTTSRDVYFSL
jgi:acid phosphatase